MELKGAIFDMDGVITDTAQVHFNAWKAIFDHFLQLHSTQTNVCFKPFSIDDYIHYVDGIGRLDGIRNFLQSRQILPEGPLAGTPSENLIFKMAEEKNKFFLDLIEKGGVVVFKSTIELIEDLKRHGMKIAVISASKNSEFILKKAGVLDLFDVIVDGNTLKELKLKGKPDPAIFIEAANRLDIKRSNIFIVEDALSGVVAAKAGHFGLIIGIDRQQKWNFYFIQQGADMVVNDLAELDYEQIQKSFTEFPPSALEKFTEIEEKIENKKIIIFSDYDGTLTPIVERPELALISDEMRRVLVQLHQVCPIIIMSGRQVADLQKRIDIKELFYIGNHGFEMVGPKPITVNFAQDSAYFKELNKAYEELKSLLASIDDCLIEHKKFTLSVHYRLVKHDKISYVEEKVNEVISQHPNLSKHYGKKVFEIRPKIDWNKGKAVSYMLQQLNFDQADIFPIYLGDDISDEDAFVELKNYGIGILISDSFKKTNASYHLKNIDEVLAFLKNILQLINKKNISYDNAQDWKLSYSTFKPEEEGLRETLCALGNGYFVTRGANEESQADKIHYPGTYFAGCYNKLESKIAGTVVVNEDIVNMPNWIKVTFKVDGSDEPWLDIMECEILDYHQELNFKEGTLARTLRIKDLKGRIFFLQFIRFVSMANQHVAFQKFLIRPENWSGNIIIKSGLEGSVTNIGVKRYAELNNKHLQLINMSAENDTISLHMHTNQSHIEIAQVAHHRLFKNNKLEILEGKIIKEDENIFTYFPLYLESNEDTSLEKIITVFTSRDPAINECYNEAKALMNFLQNDTFEYFLDAHKRAWKNIWQRCDIEIQTSRNDQQIIRLHMFHLLQTVSNNSVLLDMGVPARGLHGEAYRGHIFWDELFILPFYIFYFPEIARELLLYRYRRLNMARYSAKKAGFKGAMYPWQSGSNGEEVTQEIHLNPRSNKWIPDYSHYQRHVNAAIVYNIWHYYQATGDKHFLADFGAEMILEIARFWSSIAIYNKEIDRYEIDHVVGPDEYHEKYPDKDEPGVKNNTYTNIMAVWSIKRALEVLQMLNPIRRSELIDKLQLSNQEVEHWRALVKKIKISFLKDGIINQFEGYELLSEFDWDLYNKKYGNIERLDRILKAENDNTDNYKVSKQADLLMLFYLFSYEELSEIFSDLNYPFSQEILIKNINYYMKRTSHGSTLSKAVFAAILHYIDQDAAMGYYEEVLQSDITDLQGGTTPEGIHLGAMAAGINIILYYFVGLRFQNNSLSFNPKLPKHIDRLKFNLQYHDKQFKMMLDHSQFHITCLDEIKEDFYILINNKKHFFHHRDTIVVDTQ